MHAFMVRPDSVNSTAEDKVYAKVAWRLVPVLFICYIAVSHIMMTSSGSCPLRQHKGIA
jgi:hypothetical protein